MVLTFWSSVERSKMKVNVCIAILALFALTVRESDGSVKSEQKESDKDSLVVKVEEVKTTNSNASKTEETVKPENSKRKRGIYHYGNYGTGAGLGWPGQYASVYGYNLHLPTQGVHVARGFQSGAHHHPAIHGYPIAHGIPTGYGFPALHGVHSYQAVQPIHGIQALHGVHSAHGIQSFHGTPSLHAVQPADHSVHAIQPSHHVTHGLPNVHGLQAGIPSIQNPWQFKSHTPTHGTPFVLKPGGAVVSSFNVNYPHHHHQHFPTGVAYPPVTSVAAQIPITPVAAPIPIAPARPAPPVVPAIPVAPVPPQAAVIPSFVSQPNFPVFVQVVPARPTTTAPIGPAVPPSQFFPNVGVLPLQPLQPARPQRPSGGSAEASPQIPSSGSLPPLSQLPPSPTQQPWRPVVNPQQPLQPQFPQQPPTTISTTPDSSRPSITLLPPFVSRPQGGEASSSGQLPSFGSRPQGGEASSSGQLPSFGSRPQGGEPISPGQLLPPFVGRPQGGEAISPGQFPNNNPQSQGYHYGLGESVQPSLLDGLTDEEIQGAIAQANFQAQLQQNNNLGYQY